MSTTRRVVDVAGATLGLLLLWPVFVAIAGAIALEDDGPVFFRQSRVGVGGRLFGIWKFRTMVSDAEQCGRQLTVGDDPRITQVGCWLRRAKLDELPQLFNVLCGDMGFVGPRPEVPRYVCFYTEAQRQVLALTPGITDPASLTYFDESGLLTGAPDPERVYVERIMPEKIRLNLEYATHRSLWADLRVVASTVGRVLTSGARRMRSSAPIGSALLP